MVTTVSSEFITSAVIVSRVESTFTAEALFIPAPASGLTEPLTSVPGASEGMLGNILLGEVGEKNFMAEAVFLKVTENQFQCSSIFVSPTHSFTFSADSIFVASGSDWISATADETDYSFDVFAYCQSTSVVTIDIEREIYQDYFMPIYSTTGRVVSYTDQTPPLGTQFRYRVRGYDSSGALIGSSTTYPVSINYDSWMLTTSTGTNVPLTVVSSSLAKEIQSESFSPLGSELKTVQVGNALGKKGSIDVFVKLEDRLSTAISIEEVANSTRQSYLRTPFGLSLPVVIGSIGEKYIEGGNSIVSITYVQNGVV